VRDGVEGWVTLKVGLGPASLKSREKPFLWAAGKAAMYQKFDEASAKIRDLQVDEVFELLEGPREEAVSSEIYLKISTSNDPIQGWVTIRDTAGSTFASQSEEVYVCKSTIAMTDEFDIKKCKVVRKVSIGEALILVSGQDGQTDAKGIKRLKFRGAHDAREGWVTLKGNQGTVYVEPSKSHFKVDTEMVLRESLETGSSELRKLSKGEILHGLEAPKEVRPDVKLGVRARSLEDGKAGWVCFSSGPSPPLRPWKPSYTCKAAVALTPTLAANDQGQQQAEPGNIFEVVEGPSVDNATGLRRIRCATATDGVVGWATLRSSDGIIFLEPVA